MRTLGHVWLVAFLCLASFAASQEGDQVAAVSALGPRWKQLSRRAGIIFAGTVVSSGNQGKETRGETSNRASRANVSAIELEFRVERAIAGVESGQTITIHEWAGAAAAQRPMEVGQHVLIFLYPLSRLGFTSPVGGSAGLIDLDASGENVSKQRKSVWSRGGRGASIPPAASIALTQDVSVIQLERAVRSARLN